MTQSVQYPMYDSWDATRGRSSNTGIAMMPLAGPPPQPSVPIVLDGGCEFEWLYCMAARIGKPPAFPAPTTSNSNRVFLGGYQNAGFPIVDIGGYCLYRLAGWYWWGILNPEGLDSEFMLGGAPMPNQPTFSQESIPASFFQTNIMNQNRPALPNLFSANNEQLNNLLMQVTQSPGW